MPATRESSTRVPSVRVVGGSRYRQIEFTLGPEVCAVEARTVQLSRHLVSDWPAGAVPKHVDRLTQHAERRDGDRHADDGLPEARHTPAGIADAASESLPTHLHLECHTVVVNRCVVWILHAQLYSANGTTASVMTAIRRGTNCMAELMLRARLMNAEAQQSMPLK